MKKNDLNVNENEQININRDFKGIWIPKEIWLNHSLTYFEKSLLAELHSLDGEKGCFASNSYLCKFFNERERKIQDGLAKLKNLGYIWILSFDGRTRVIRTSLTPKPVENKPFKSKIKGNQNSESDKSLFSTSALSKIDTSALSKIDTSDRGPHNILYNSIENRLYNTPPSPAELENISRHPEFQDTEQSANAETAKAVDVGCVEKKSAHKEKKAKEPARSLDSFSSQVVEMGQKMLEICKKNVSTFRSPKNMIDFLRHIEIMLEEERQDPVVLMKLFEWAAADNLERGDFKGWRSVVCRNTRKGKPSNPAENFMLSLQSIQTQNSSKKDRKFAPSSNDERSLEKMEEWMKGAI